MDLKITLIDKALPMPSYQTDGSVAFDLYARIDTIIKPHIPTIIPLNVIIKIPEKYFLLLAARSSLPLKKSLIIANGIGIIDQDYCGKNDEIGLEVMHFLNKDIEIKRGERIAQAMLIQFEKVRLFEKNTDSLGSSRGGFGSTD